MSGGAILTLVQSFANMAGYGSGTPYTLTATAAQVAFSTTSPVFTLAAAGIWMFFAGCTVDYVGATLLGNRTISVKLRRTNNTAGDITGAISSFQTQVITALTFTAQSLVLPVVTYQTSNVDDSISIFGSISTVPTLGSVQVTNAWVVGVQIA